MPNEKRASPLSWIDADEPERQPQEQAEKAAHQRCAEQRRHGSEREQRQREVLGGPERERDGGERRREQRERERRERAGDERADARPS